MFFNEARQDMTPQALIHGLVWSDSLNSFLALALGFAVAGLLCSAYQVMTERAPSFSLLEASERNQALAAIPFLLFAAPAIIVRVIVRAGRGSGFGFAMLATVLAGFWSLMSGTLVIMALKATGGLVA